MNLKTLSVPDLCTFFKNCESIVYCTLIVFILLYTKRLPSVPGHFYIMLKTPHRWYMFETETKTNALDWIETLRGELEILKPLYKHKDEILYSL